MPFVDYTVNEGIAVIRLNRPERLNAFGAEVAADFRAAYSEFARDGSAQVAILCGAGKSFCAGRDLKEEANGGRRDVLVEPPSPLIDSQRYRLRNESGETDKPIIAAVHGYASGAGAALAINCDYKIAAADAVFFYPEVATGIPGPWEMSTYHVVPWAWMLEVSLLGRRISAERFAQMGFLNEVVARGHHEERAMAVAREFQQLPQEMLRATKRLMTVSRRRPRPEAIAERNRIAKLSTTTPELGKWRDPESTERSLD